MWARARLLVGASSIAAAGIPLQPRAASRSRPSPHSARRPAPPRRPRAPQYIHDAIREFENTSEEVRVTVADCELAIARGDVEGALKKLRRIPDTSPHYVKARMAMADIYLRHRKDKAAYIKCYLDLVVGARAGREGGGLGAGQGGVGASRLWQSSSLEGGGGGGGSAAAFLPEAPCRAAQQGPYAL